MDNLGVTLKSPTEHQRKLLAMLKPKSPMKLRKKVLPVKKGGQTQKQRSSMKHYFTSDEKPCSSKHNTDFELAAKLQSEFYSEIGEQLNSPSRTLLVSNSPIT